MQSIAISMSVYLFVCLSFSPLTYLKATRLNFKFSVHVTCGRDSVLLSWQCNMSCASDFVSDFVFTYTALNRPESRWCICFVQFATWRHPGQSLPSSTASCFVDCVWLLSMFCNWPHCPMVYIGHVCSHVVQEDILSLWNRTAIDQTTTSRIRDTLKRVLNLPPSTIMEYKTHTDSLRSVISFVSVIKILLTYLNIAVAVNLSL